MKWHFLLNILPITGKKDMKTTKTQGKLNQGKLKQNCCCEPCIKRYWKIKKIIDTLELHSF